MIALEMIDYDFVVTIKYSANINDYFRLFSKASPT
jgi:hypothetical protein